MIAPINFNFDEFWSPKDSNSHLNPIFKLQMKTNVKSPEYIHVYEINKNVQATKLNEFLTAISEGNILEARSLLNPSTDLEKEVNYKKDDEVHEKITALGIATLNNNVPLIKFLLRSGADLRGGETSAEILAVQNMEECSDALKFLLDYMQEKNIKAEIATLF